MQQQGVNVPSDLDGARKVAALMLALYPVDQELVGKLLKKFSKPEVLRITSSASELGALTQETITGLIAELTDELAAGPGIIGNATEADELLRAAMPGNSVEQWTDGEASPPPPGFWERLAQCDPTLISATLKNEPPQIVAYILGNLPPDRISKCMETFDPLVSADILARMTSIENVAPVAELCTEKGLSELLDAPAPEERKTAGRLVEMLNLLDTGLRGTLLEKLRETKPAEAADLAKMLFDFPDIVTLPQAARQAVVERLETAQIATALNGEAREVCEAFLSTMGVRARKMMEQELNDARPLPKPKILDAQKAISARIVEMIRNGEISRESEPA